MAARVRRVPTLLNIEVIAEEITGYVNKSGLLEHDIQLIAEDGKDEARHPNILITFKINERTYSRVVYNVDAEGSQKGYLSATGQGTYAELSPGSKVGYFLFNLHILLAILTHTQTFAIHNMADHPARAAKGIYSGFTVDMKGHDAKAFTEKSRKEIEELLRKPTLLEHQLWQSEGAMKYPIRGDSLKEWKDKMKKLSEDLAGRKDIPEGDPWKSGVKANMNNFLNFITQYYSVSVGGKKRRRRKTKKRKTKKRKTKKR